MPDVAIIGVGLHPFGRFPGKSAIEMGADAVRLALKDAGIEWRDVQFAFGGSYEADNPDAVVNQLGLTGIPFTDVYNGCATAASALSMAARAITSGEYEIGIAVGMDKHQPGAFAADPVDYSLPRWYGEAGFFLTSKFFAMKLQRYMHDYGITPQTLARVAAKNYRNGSLEPQRVPAHPCRRRSSSRMVNDPLTQYMFCSPDEGRPPSSVPRRHRQPVHPSSGLPAGIDVRTRRFGAFEVHTPSAVRSGADR